MRHKQLTLKGAATDPILAAKVWTRSEEQTGIAPTSSVVGAVAAAGANDINHT
jgi:hypothetical protein